MKFTKSIPRFWIHGYILEFLFFKCFNDVEMIDVTGICVLIFMTKSGRINLFTWKWKDDLLRISVL